MSNLSNFLTPKRVNCVWEQINPCLVYKTSKLLKVIYFHLFQFERILFNFPSVAGEWSESNESATCSPQSAMTARMCVN